MGNCMASDIISDQIEKEDVKKKIVRPKLVGKDGVGRENYGNSRSGVVRIRVVVTQEELKQILSSGYKYSSAEQLLRAMKSRSRKVSKGIRSIDGGNNGSWRPALESIPEDH